MATESNDNHKTEEEIEFEELWSLKTSDIYKLALQFFKEKNGGKALVLTYNDRLMLFALIKQVAYGKYDPSLVPENGLFDVIGNNRRRVWESLSDMSKSKAMMEFVKLIHSVCPLFASVVEAHKIEKEEKERRIKEELEERERMARAKQEEELRQQQEVVEKYKAKELLIRNALNQQTYQQFLAYAQNQYPFDKAQQEILISQLQEQHFNQYVQQAYNHQQQQHQQQQQHRQQQKEQRQDRQAMFDEPPKMSENSSTNHLPSNLQPSNGSIPVAKDCSTTSTLENEESKHEKVLNAGHVTPEIVSKRISENNSEHSLGMEAASEWTRKDIRDFKESLKAENEAVIKVGSGELVTIRVPTHEHGTSLFWEFATDGLDIGFGLSFEWFGPEEKQNHEEGRSEGKQVDVIIPITRTQSHVEVQCGSHQYPGTGIYLLMFDNSYSLWRSKSIYYRVFYSQ